MTGLALTLISGKNKHRSKIMSAIIRRRVPARALSRKEFLTPFDRLFDDMLNDVFPAFHRQYGEDFFSKGSYPKVNVINHEDCVTIEAAIPGLTKEDIQVEVTEGVLSIIGTSNQNEQIKDSQYVKREIKKSSFRRSFTLNDDLDSEKISAEFDNGILSLSIPKVNPEIKEPKTRQIKIG